MKDKHFSADEDRQPVRKDADDQRMGQIGESVEEIMNKMNVEPPEDFAERSFQYTLEGIQEARKKFRRKRWTNRVVQFSGSLGLVAVVALLVFQLVSPQERTGDEGHLDQPSVEEQKPPEEGELPVEEEQEDNLNAVEREPTKEITVYPEGMEETRTFQLLDEPSIPFTTYIPEGYAAEPIEIDGLEGVRVVQNYDFVYMDILFFPEGTTEEEAREGFADVVTNMELQDTDIEDSGISDGRDEPWVLQSYSSFPLRAGSGRKLYLGSGANYYFYVHIEINNLEVLDGWAPTVDTIYQEWRWKGTGEGLEE